MISNVMSIKRIWAPDEEYTHHRIPGIFITSKGTVIIYNEARRGGSDWAHMDIYVQRSEDGGESFGDPIYIACGDEQYKTVNNPVMLEDGQGTLHMLYLRDYSINGGGAWQRTSVDDGLTWSEPKDITGFTRPELHNAFAFGPGHGIRTKSGMLTVPVWLVPKSANVPVSEHWPSVTSTFCSKDNGKTWFLGEIIESVGGCLYPGVVYPNESVAAETSDGRIIMSVRSFNRYRSLTYSQSGYDGWSRLEARKDLPDPCCFGSIAKYDGLNGKYALISVNCADEHDRINVTLRISYDDGRTWNVKRTVDAERGGYCDIATDEKNGNIYVLYEDKGGSVGVYLAKINANSLI